MWQGKVSECNNTGLAVINFQYNQNLILALVQYRKPWVRKLNSICPPQIWKAEFGLKTGKQGGGLKPLFNTHHIIRIVLFIVN